MAQAFETVEEYISSFPPATQARLEELRATLLAAIPGAEERISYAIPAVRLDGKYVIYYSGWKAHLALYPVPPVPSEVEAELAPYRSGVSTLKFPLRKPTPLDLVSRIAAYALAARHA